MPEMLQFRSPDWPITRVRNDREPMMLLRTEMVKREMVEDGQRWPDGKSIRVWGDSYTHRQSRSKGDRCSFAGRMSLVMV